MGIPTTTEAEYKRLRSYLTPYIKGSNTDAVLTALASSTSSYLINNVAAVNDMLYIVSAAGTYLDERLAQYGITRPSAVGLSDDIFSHIGIQVKNRKQVRDLINQILFAMFGTEYVVASNSSNFFEPYFLKDGDTLIINFDESNTATITFSTDQFANIATATAQEIADVITTTLRNMGLTGSAIVQNNGNGNYVEILSNTIGPVSSVTVLGGSAQNVLQFDSIIPAGGNMSTQWTLSLQPGGLIKFTWSGGANPNIGKVSAGNYVNIFGGGFTSSPNEGSYTIIKSVGGAVNVAYFEVENPFGTSGIVVQGTDNAILFYNPIKKTIISNYSYAAVFQTQNRILQIFLPATTKVVRRSRLGSAHLHYPPSGIFTLNVNPSPGDIFGITSTINLIAGVNFTIGLTPVITAQNLTNAINMDIPGLIANINSSSSIDGEPLDQDLPNSVLIQSDSAALSLKITYTGSQNITASGPRGDNTSLAPNQPGPYMYDATQPFTVSSVNTNLEQELDGTKPRIIQVGNSSQFPNQFGYIILGYGTQNQEGPIPYISTPSNNTILISPAYTVRNVFQSGTSVFLVAQKNPPIVEQDGMDYGFYITDVVAGRIYAQDLITSIAATGITLVFTVLYPSDLGLGKFRTIYSEISAIYGP